ncbi:zinc finger protein 277 [Chironomus tepperi]|uniref:zinc finger protein 277 n=1 Tax=Chironomus tepperi TaxID=113505 RepID=UPI00391F3648
MDKIANQTILQPLTLDRQSPEGSKQHKDDDWLCIICDHIEKNEKDSKKILQHLYFTHHLIISDANDIADLREYLKFWNKEYKGQKIEEYCTTMLWKQKPDGTKTEEDEKYYLLSDIVPKDKELRMNLQKKKVEVALARHQFERSDRNYIRGCLYCRSAIDPTRYSYIEHLYSKHFLHLGKPENLVFIDELIDFLEEKLSNLVCIYCEKIFKDRATLKEHMRKKGHKKINPENKAYDRFFMVNYKIKEPTIKSQNPQKSYTPRDLHENNFDDDDKEIFENEDSEWNEWNEQDKEILTTCLFCTHKDKDFNELLGHMKLIHNFNFEEITINLNFYKKVKLVNYIRRKVHLKQCLSCDESFENAEILLTHLSHENHNQCDVKSFDKPEFFFPTFEDDNFLCHLDNFDENDDMSDDSFGAVISEDRLLSINEDAEMLSREKFIDI